MKKLSLILIYIFCLTFPVYSQVNPEITVEELKEHVKYLADDKLEGRKPATEGSKLAAEYIVNHLKEYGFSFFDDNPYQNFEIITGIHVGENNHFSYNDEDFRSETDFIPTTLSSNGEVSGKAVFIGYGFDIESPHFSWNDYKDVDTEGKILFMLRGAPAVDSLESVFEDYTALTKKVLAAKDHGAAAVVFVSGKDFDETDELMPLRTRSGIHGIGIPIIHISRFGMNKILESSNVTVEEMEGYYKKQLKPNTLVLDGDVSLGVNLVEETAQASNIVAYIEGSDPVLKNEYVLIGAHYDHLGFGGPGSGSRRPDLHEIHNGADDNASGSAAILEIAEKLAANKAELKRSVIYAAFDSEEMGLLGSKAFAEKPPVELTSIKFMANLDMVGRLDSADHNLTVGGTGTAVEMEDILNKISAGTQIVTAFSPEGLGPSDHATFYANNIPVMFLFSGMNHDYHTPDDDYDRINYDGMKMIADYAYNVVEDVINRDAPLTFQEAGPKEREEGQHAFKVTLGIMPDYTDSSDEGMKIDAVMPDKPAQKAGMLRGDIITSIKGKPVGNIYDYMHRLGELKKGEIVDVEVIRDGEKITIPVQL